LTIVLRLRKTPQHTKILAEMLKKSKMAENFGVAPGLFT
jgi:hypothetical protein